METNNILRKVTKHVWDFILFKLRFVPIPVIKNVPGINKEMIHNLSMSIWIETYVSLSNWKDFVYRNCLRMNESYKLYTTYVIYACHIEKKCCKDPCEAFVRLMALVIQMALYSSEDQQEELLKYSREIWVVFFEIELKKEFYAKGGWKKLHSYLQQLKPIELYKSLENLENAMKFPQQIVEELELASALPNQISEHLSQDIKMTEIESHQLTIRMLKSIDRVLESIQLEYLSAKQDSAETSSGKKLTCDSANRHSKSVLPKGKTKDGKDSKDVVDQTTRLPPTQRISTRQTYLRAKEMLQILQNEFMKIDDQLSFLCSKIFEHIDIDTLNP